MIRIKNYAVQYLWKLFGAGIRREFVSRNYLSLQYLGEQSGAGVRTFLVRTVKCNSIKRQLNETLFGAGVRRVFEGTPNKVSYESGAGAGISWKY